MGADIRKPTAAEIRVVGEILPRLVGEVVVEVGLHGGVLVPGAGEVIAEAAGGGGPGFDFDVGVVGGGGGELGAADGGDVGTGRRELGCEFGLGEGAVAGRGVGLAGGAEACVAAGGDD
jgi:hypothetical protein